MISEQKRWKLFWFFEAISLVLRIYFKIARMLVPKMVKNGFTATTRRKK
jgi:hypothetical protein